MGDQRLEFHSGHLPGPVFLRKSRKLAWLLRQFQLCPPRLRPSLGERAHRARPGGGWGKTKGLELPSCSSAVFSADRKSSSQLVTAIFPPPSNAPGHCHGNYGTHDHFRMTREVFWELIFFFFSQFPTPQTAFIGSHGKFISLCREILSYFGPVLEPGGVEMFRLPGAAFCPSWESLVHASCSCCGCGTSAPVLPTSSCEGTLHQLRLNATSLQLRGSDPRDEAATGAGAQRAHNFPRSLTPQVFFCECTLGLEKDDVRFM